MASIDEERKINLALQAIEKDQTLSARAAATIYKCSHATLSRRLKGTQSRYNSMPNSRNLTSLEEVTIVQYILDLDARLYPPRLADVEDMANRLLAERDTPPVGKRWASNFVKRQPELRTRFLRRYDYKRAQCEDPETIRAWFVLVKNVITKYGVVDADIYNFDETGFIMGIISTGMVVTRAERHSNVKLVQPGNREWVTVIQGVNAQGWTVPPFIIVSGKYHLSSWYQDSALPRDWVIATSSNGWTTNERGLEWIRHFDQYTKPRTTGKYRLLVLNGYESHHSIDFELYCKENDIITLCMPAHSSHILQPLDVGCFGPLKRAYGGQIEKRVRAGTTHISKEDFFPAFLAAFQATITVSNIQAGFRGAGLIPYDPESVIARLDVKLRTPTPEIQPPAVTQAWVSKTPNNPTEAGSQSEFIKSRVSLHQGSSPTPILKAIDQFTKGATGIMHQIALLKSEVKTLREDNALLSRRRRTKKKHLREGGSMTLEEGQLLESRSRIEVVVKQETQRDGGQRRRAETRPRRCGVCHNAGHNSRTCQIVVSSSEEEDSE
jgi:DDE superfamily endonuclease/helix-turn-helix, Psq domain